MSEESKPIEIFLFIVIIIILIFIVVSIFFNAPNPAKLVGMVIDEGIKLIWGGIKKSSLALTTLG